MDIFSKIPLAMPLPSDEEIDVVIPVAKKDISILPLCLQGVRKNVTNTIKSIYVVAASDDYIKQFCKDNNTIFVDERSVLRFGPNDLNLIVRGNLDRSGWLFQQFIKLSGKVGTCENYLCVDSDHILIKPHTFLAKGNIPVFYMSAELCQPYYDLIRKITSLRRLSSFSYVSHKMIFNKTYLKIIHNEIERHTNQIWYKGILDNYDKNEGAGFSEYELYGNYVSNNIQRPWREKTLTYNKLSSFTDLCNSYSTKYNCVTFPDYINTE